MILGNVKFSFGDSKNVVLGLIGKMKYFRESFVRGPYPFDVQNPFVSSNCFSLKFGCLAFLDLFLI